VRESIGLAEDQTRFYVRAMNDFFYAFAIAAAGPEKVWEVNAGFGYDINSAMLVERSGVVFYGTKNDRLIALEAKTGAIKWQHKLGTGVMNTVVPLSSTRVLTTDFDAGWRWSSPRAEGPRLAGGTVTVAVGCSRKCGLAPLRDWSRRADWRAAGLRGSARVAARLCADRGRVAAASAGRRSAWRCSGSAGPGTPRGFACILRAGALDGLHELLHPLLAFFQNLVNRSLCPGVRLSSRSARRRNSMRSMPGETACAVATTVPARCG